MLQISNLAVLLSFSCSFHFWWPGPAKGLFPSWPFSLCNHCCVIGSPKFHTAFQAVCQEIRKRWVGGVIINSKQIREVKNAPDITIWGISQSCCLYSYQLAPSKLCKQDRLCPQVPPQKWACHAALISASLSSCLVCLFVCVVLLFFSHIYYCFFFQGTSTPSSQSKSALSEVAADRLGVRHKLSAKCYICHHQCIRPLMFQNTCNPA